MLKEALECTLECQLSRHSPLVDMFFGKSVARYMLLFITPQAQESGPLGLQNYSFLHVFWDLKKRGQLHIAQKCNDTISKPE